MTVAEEAIEYIKSYRKLDENLHNIAPNGTVSFFATKKCLKYWDMAIEALERELKPGHWIKTENEFVVPSRFNPIKEIISTCSICGSRYMGIHEDFKYCPNCGARIEGETV